MEVDGNFSLPLHVVYIEVHGNFHLPLNVLCITVHRDLHLLLDALCTIMSTEKFPYTLMFFCMKVQGNFYIFFQGVYEKFMIFAFRLHYP